MHTLVKEKGDSVSLPKIQALASSASVPFTVCRCPAVALNCVNQNSCHQLPYGFGLGRVAAARIKLGRDNFDVVKGPFLDCGIVESCQ